MSDKAKVYDTFLEFRKDLVNNSKDFTNKEINDLDFELLIDAEMNELIKNKKVIVREDL